MAGIRPGRRQHSINSTQPCNYQDQKLKAEVNSAWPARSPRTVSTVAQKLWRDKALRGYADLTWPVQRFLLLLMALTCSPDRRNIAVMPAGLLQRLKAKGLMLKLKRSQSY